MRHIATTLFLGLVLLGGVIGAASPAAAWTKDSLALCLAEKGWVMYGSITCSACRAQRKAFGKSFEHITEVECNPHIPNNQVELCLKRKIKKTPTWIREKDGKEIGRIVSYQLLEDLARLTDCEK